jgi:hypothetical protein
MDFTENLYIENTLIFDNEDKYLPFESINYNENQCLKFGILNLKAGQAFLNEKLIYEFLFTIDSSGSMSDKCADGRTKIQHIIHTITNMIYYFKENSKLNVFVTINTFDSKLKNIVERTNINYDNFQFILDKINTIVPKDSTNIELALNSVKKTITEIKNINSEHQISHIFMTDGEITQGCADYNNLSSLVDKSITNIFIGFGLDHDSVLLNTLSEVENSAYYFIDKLENSGLVYGEILHGIIYKLLYNVKINIENGLIYNFKTNIWVSNLLIGEIVGEANKFFHIVSSSPNICSVKINATKVIDNLDLHFNKIVNFNNNNNNNNNLTKFIYRQRTLEHLFSVKDFLRRRNDKNITNEEYIFGYLNECEKESSFLKEEEKKLRDKLTHFLEDLKKYMNENNLKDDIFWKNLCDDIYITFRTFGTRFGAMFVTARQTNQGTQRCTTVGNSIDTINNTKIPTLKLPRLKKNDLYINDDEYIVDENRDCFYSVDHELSDIGNTPYLTPSSTQMMREISYNRNNHKNVFNLKEEDEETQII